MRKDAGMSLIELSIVSIILGAIVAITMGLMITSSRNATNQAIQGHIEDRGTAIVDACKREFGYAKMSGSSVFTLNSTNALGIAANTNGTEVRFQHVVNVDTSTSTNTVTYGYTSKVGTDTGASLRVCVIRFEPHTVIRESSSAPSTTIAQFAATWSGSTWAGVAPPSTLDTEIVNLDINQDGDKADRFLVGKLMKYVTDSAGARLTDEELSDYVMLRYDSATAMYSSLTGTAVGDQIFSYLPTTATLATNATQIKANVMLGRLDERRQKFLTTTCSEQIRLRSKQ